LYGFCIDVLEDGLSSDRNM